MSPIAAMPLTLLSAPRSAPPDSAVWLCQWPSWSARAEAKHWLADIIEKAAALKVGSGFDAATDVGPMISPQALQRAEKLIQSAIDQGATVALDGRGVVVDGFEKGNFLGPTVVTGVTAEMDIYKEEVFGPVLCVMETETLDESIDIINANEYGNGAFIFTSSGHYGRKFQDEVEPGQLGINVAIPVFPAHRMLIRELLGTCPFVIGYCAVWFSSLSALLPGR